MNIVLMEDLGVSREIIEGHREKLNKMGHTLIEYPKNTDSAVQVEETREADVIILANMPLSPQVIKEATGLKFIDVAFTGVDHIPVAEAKEKGIAISNASGYATRAVAELCISFMISLLRNVDKTQASCRMGGTKAGLIGNLLWGKTLGIVGAGAIGKQVAAFAGVFGCRVITYSRSRVTDPNFNEQVELDTLLSTSDIVSLHCPLTEETKGLIGERELALMKPTALLINTARGPVVDTSALATALNKGVIVGAALDVFDKEPPLDEDYPLLHTPNTLVTPHIAFASKESMEMRGEIVFNNLYSWLEGKQINCI